MRLAFMDNPITRAELAHQRWVRLPLHGLDKLAPPMGICLALFLGAVIGSMFGFDVRPIGETLWPLFYILFVIAIATHFNAMIQALTLAADSVAREKRRGTWDVMLLTNVDARQIVYGKWWATVQQTWPRFLAAGILRLGLVFWLWLGLEATYRFGIYVNPYDVNPTGVLWAGAAVILLCLANTGISGAFGILAALLNPNGGQVLALAFILRVVTLITTGSIMWLMSDMIIQPSSGLLLLINYGLLGAGATKFLKLSSITMIDNGSILAIGLAGNTLGRPMDYYEYLLHLLIPLALYALLTWLALRLAQALAVRQGALRPSRHLRDKPKNKKLIA